MSPFTFHAMNDTSRVTSETIDPENVALETRLGNQDNANIVNFDGLGDPENPLSWSPTYKWSIVVLISVMSLVV